MMMGITIRMTIFSKTHYLLYCNHQNSNHRHRLHLYLIPLTRLFASMFIHANVAHIAFNLFALVYLGGYAERAIGVTRYLLVYFTSGIVAALFHDAIASYVLHNGDVVLIGASGAISGILGVAAVAGNTRAYYWLMLQIIFAVIGSISALPIAFTAHVGGFVAGAGMTKVLVRLEQTKRKSRYFLQP